MGEGKQLKLGWFYLASASIRFIFSPRKFKALDEPTGAAQVKEQLDAVDRLRPALIRSFRVVIGLGCLSAVAGWVCFNFCGPNQLWSIILQAIGVAAILLATFWELSLPLSERTIDGVALVEQVHGWIFKNLYILGSVLFFFAYAWSVDWTVRLCIIS